MAIGYDGSIKIDTKIDTKGITAGTTAINAGLKLVQGSAVEAGAALAAAFAPAIIVTAIIAIGNAMVNMGKQAVELASDLNEVQNVVDTTFEGSADAVNQFSKTAIEQFGLSELAAKRFASTMGAMLKSMGISLSDATDMSITLAGLAGDIASFYNLDAQDAFDKLRSGISGETEPLKQLGINLSVANLQAFAMSKGITASYDSMTEAQKAMLRYQYILQATGDAQGDFAKTSDSWANQTRILSEKWNEFLSIIGSGLIQVLTPLLRIVNKILDGMISLANTIGSVINTLTGYTQEASNMADTADLAAGNEDDLADSITNASEAAKKAMAPFDDLNILQTDLANGSSPTFDLASLGDVKDAINQIGDATSGNTDGITVPVTPVLPDPPLPPFEPMTVEVSPEINTPVYTAEDWGLIPPPIPEPEVTPLPSPVFNPSWNLTPPIVPAPEVEPLPTPVFQPEWNLAESLEAQLAEVRNTMPQLDIVYEDGMARIRESVVETQENTAQNTAEMASVNTQNLLSFAGATSAIFGYIGPMVTTPVHDAMLYLIDTFIGGYSASYSNTLAWANAMQNVFSIFGKNVGEILSNSAVSWFDIIINWFQSAWDSLTSLASAAGENISSFWNANNETIVKVAIAGVAVAGIAGALALSGGTLAAPLAAAASAGAGLFATVPAFATGAVIPPNAEFMAILGDQTSGYNYEVPDKKLRQLIREELNGAGSNIPIVINYTAELDGDAIWKNQQKVSAKRGTSLVGRG